MNQEGSGAGGASELGSLDVDQVTQLVSAASDDQLREGMSGENRDAVIDEVFRRMEEHFKPESAQGVDAVIHWRIGGRPDGGVDQREVVVRDGKCTVSREPQADPRVTLAMDGVDFLRLVTGAVAGPVMFMSGKLRIEGDLMFAASVASMFTIPGAGPEAGPAPAA